MAGCSKTMVRDKNVGVFQRKSIISETSFPNFAAF